MPDRTLRFVLFDLDGVLADSREPIARCLNAALADHGLAPEPVARLHGLIGPPLRHAFEVILAGREGKPPEIESLIAAYRRHYERASLDTPLYPGVEAALDALAARATLAVATSKPVRFARPILEARGVADRFAAIVGPPLEATHQESKTGTVGRALARIQAPAAESALVGDRLYDMQAAVHHGLLGVAALWGFGSRDELESAGATLYLDSPVDLHQL